MALFIVATLFFISTAPARAEVTPEGALMVANVAGECDVLYSMIEFQKSSPVNGGEEYVARFWASEAAKSNMTVEQLSDRCRKSSAAFDKLWGSFTQKEQTSANGNE